MPAPEARARQHIDRLLAATGWLVQDHEDLNLGAGPGVAVREYALRTGTADYLLFVDRKAIGAVEAKPEGVTLSGVEGQSAKYRTGLPTLTRAWRDPLPFLYETTGVETYFTNGLDPEPRSRRVFAFHRPETLRAWVQEPTTLRARLRQLPPLQPGTLWPVQIAAVTNLERSLAADQSRALIQMATGSGKTVTAISAIYQLIKFGGVRRVVFLVDRSNLGRQALTEFQQFETPDDGRKFTELYNVQRLTTNTLDPVSRVCITTIQRLYSMLAGEEDLDPELEEQSLLMLGAAAEQGPPKEVRYNPALPPEYFDLIITDECHRSIYNLWRQVLEYFDAYLVGLTATPSKQTLGFFNQNLVMEYSRERAVADRVNVDGQVYRIRTAIGEQGSTVEAGFYVDRRDRRTRERRWAVLDEPLAYEARQLDRQVVAESQIRTVIRTFRDRLFTEIFPTRTEVPKTLIYAKDDSHAEDIVRIVREEFGRGNEFCQKITYRVTGVKPEQLISDFRNSYNPRIAVTVDMIATGTDIKPLEVLLFLRAVESRVLYEQMLGRGTRVINADDLQAVTPDARSKDGFVIVDAVGVVESLKVDTQTLERKRSVPLGRLLEAVAHGATDDDTLSTLAGRLARLGRQATAADQEAIVAASGGQSLSALANALLDAMDPDKHWAAASALTGVEDPPEAEIAQAAAHLLEVAVTPFDNPQLRKMLVALLEREEQIIDTVSIDEVREAGFSAEATDRARATVESFRQFLETHRDEITALQILYNQPYNQQRLTFQQVKELAALLAQPPQGWTADALWGAYAVVERDRVRGTSLPRALTDLVALVRHAAGLDGELRPYAEQVRTRYESWVQAQEAAGRGFTPEQRWWLDQIAAHIGVNLTITSDDFDYGEFFNRGGQIAAVRAFGPTLSVILEELNTTLAA